MGVCIKSNYVARIITETFPSMKSLMMSRRKNLLPRGQAEENGKGAIDVVVNEESQQWPL